MSAPRWYWNLHGRYLTHESAGWPVARTRKRVYHFDDWCLAASEEEARGIFEKEHGPPAEHRQWTHFWRGNEFRLKSV